MFLNCGLWHGDDIGWGDVVTDRDFQAPPKIDVLVRVSKNLETSFVPQMFFIEGMFDRLTSIGICFFSKAVAAGSVNALCQTNDVNGGYLPFSFDGQLAKIGYWFDMAR